MLRVNSKARNRRLLICALLFFIHPLFAQDNLAPTSMTIDSKGLIRYFEKQVYFVDGQPAAGARLLILRDGKILFSSHHDYQATDGNGLLSLRLRGPTALHFYVYDDYLQLRGTGEYALAIKKLGSRDDLTDDDVARHHDDLKLSLNIGNDEDLFLPSFVSSVRIINSCSQIEFNVSSISYGVGIDLDGDFSYPLGAAFGDPSIASTACLPQIKLKPGSEVRIPLPLPTQPVVAEEYEEELLEWYNSPTFMIGLSARNNYVNKVQFTTRTEVMPAPGEVVEIVLSEDDDDLVHLQ